MRFRNRCTLSFLNRRSRQNSASLTEPAIQLVPLLAQMGAWGRRHTPASKELSIRAQLLEEGGPPMWDAFMAELRAMHLGEPAKGPSVLAALQAAYERVVAEEGVALG